MIGLQDAYQSRLSADGSWVFYWKYPKRAAAGSTPVHLMRIPVGGGVPQRVLKTSADELGYSCARAPASLCGLTEAGSDEKHLTRTAFDPLKGRGKVLRTIQKDPETHFAGGMLSPEGTTFAISRAAEGKIHICLLSLAGGSDSEITEGWPNITGLDWSPDGKRRYVGSVSPQGGTLLYVDLKGNFRVLWQVKGMERAIWGVPSPDGPLPRHKWGSHQQHRLDVGRLLSEALGVWPSSPPWAQGSNSDPWMPG